MSGTKSMQGEDIDLLLLVYNNIADVFPALVEHFAAIRAAQIPRDSSCPGAFTFSDHNLHGMEEDALRALDSLKDDGLIEHSFSALRIPGQATCFRSDPNSPIRLTEKGKDALGLKNGSSEA